MCSIRSDLTAAHLALSERRAGYPQLHLQQVPLLHSRSAHYEESYCSHRQRGKSNIIITLG